MTLIRDHGWYVAPFGVTYHPAPGANQCECDPDVAAGERSTTLRNCRAKCWGAIDSGRGGGSAFRGRIDARAYADCAWMPGGGGAVAPELEEVVDGDKAPMRRGRRRIRALESLGGKMPLACANTARSLVVLPLAVMNSFRLRWLEVSTGALPAVVERSGRSVL